MNFHNAINGRRSVILTLAISIFGLSNSVSAQDEISRSEMKNLVERSYAYVALYNTISNFALNDKNPYSTHGWNKIYRPKGLVDHTVTAIAGPNNDTLYVISMLDLRAEPIVVSYPAFSSKYVSLETSSYDHYCDVPLATSKGDFREPATVLYYSEHSADYNGEAIAGIDLRHKMSGDFAAAFLRVMPQANDPELFKANMQAVQDVTIQTLSEFQGGQPKPVTPISPPAFSGDKKVFTTNFLEVMQYVFNHSSFDPADEMDQATLATLAKVGVVPGKTFHADEMMELDYDLIAELVDEVAAEGTATANDYLYDKFKSKGEMSLGAMVSQSVTGPVGLPATQAIYLQLEGANGEPMNALHDYKLEMTKENLPPAGAFWSVTLYDGEKFLFIPNDQRKYSIGENAGMKLNDAGGITIHIAAEKPDGVPAENWLPISRSDLPLNARLRVYVPDVEAMKVWTAPKFLETS